MVKESLTTLFKLSLVTLLVAAALYLSSQWNVDWVNHRSYYLILILFLLTALTTVGNVWASKHKLLITSFIASQVIRMLFCIVVLYFFISADPDGANSLVINFFIIYLIFLVFEISTLLSNLRAEFRKPE